MQNTGSLRKRKKRNLAKVNGLSTIVYKDSEDYFDLESNENGGNSHSHDFIVRSGVDTRIRINSSKHYPQLEPSPLTRVSGSRPFHEAERGSASGDLMEMQPTDRTHFLDKSTLSRLRLLIFLGVATGSFPWWWNSNNHCIDKWSPRLRKFWRFQWFFVTIQTVLLTFYQFYAFSLEISTGKGKSYREIFMSSFSVVWYTSAVYFNVNMYFYMDHTRQYINSLLRFNKENVDRYVIHLEDYQDGGRVVINGAIPSNCTQVFISVTLFLVMPFQPWYLFSYIYPKPWYWLIPGAIHEFIVVGQVITSYLLTAWLVVAHANSVSFWLKESHNHYDSDYTRDSIRNSHAALEIYRGLHVLNTIFNDCVAPMAIPMFKVLILTAMIPCGYVLIRSMDHKFIDEFPGILTYPLGVFDCVTAGFVVLNMAAEMCDLASSFMDSWSRTRHKNLRRVIMSCPCLKARVGRFYFITVSTTITFFKAIFDLITDCIITFP